MDWPDDLRDVIGNHVFMIGGGSYYTGQDYAPLDRSAIESAARSIKDHGLTSVAISSVFAPIRRFLPNTGGLDFSPIVVFIGIIIAQGFVIRTF